MWTLPIVTNGSTNDVPAPLNGWIVESLTRWCDEERGVIFSALSVTLGKRVLWRKGKTRGSWDYTRSYHVISQQGRDGGGWGNHPNLSYTQKVHQGCHNPQKSQLHSKLPDLDFQFLCYCEQHMVNIGIFKYFVHIVIGLLHNCSCFWAFCKDMPYRLNTCTAAT